MRTSTSFANQKSQPGCVTSIRLPWGTTRASAVELHQFTEDLCTSPLACFAAISKIAKSPLVQGIGPMGVQSALVQRTHWEPYLWVRGFEVETGALQDYKREHALIYDVCT